MDPLETTVGGTYRDGKIVLDRPMKWADGTRLVVQLYDEQGGQIEGVWPADGSESGNAEILRRMQEYEKEEIPLDEACDFTAVLEEIEREEKEMLRWWHEKRAREQH
jgi:hypothetical protein